VPEPSLAVATVPDVIFEALIAVKATPFPETVVKAPVVPLNVVAFAVVAVTVPLTLKLPAEPDRPLTKFVPSQ
jgi:hypothetical protein